MTGIRFFLTVFFVCFWISTAFAAAPKAVLNEKHRTVFKEYCASCHNAEKQKGKLRLDDIPFTVDTIERADVWQKILNALNSGEMPPEEEKQVPANLKVEFLDDLAQTLVVARKTLSDSGGNIAMRRLNRREYKNTLRDLLGVEVDVRDLPTDGGAGTFDTVGSSLFMSSDQFEQYLTIGRRALDEHFARAVPVARTFKKHVETEEVALKEVSAGVNNYRKGMERFQKWAAAVDAIAVLPEHADLVKELRDKADVKANPPRFYVHWSKRMPIPNPKDFGLTDGDEAEFQRGQARKAKYGEDYLELPHKDTGSYLLVSMFHAMDRIAADRDWPAGKYTLRVRLGALEDAPAERRFLQVGQQGGGNNGFDVISTHQVSGTIEKPSILEIPILLKSDGDRTFCLREKTDTKPEAAYSLWAEHFQKHGTGPKPALWIDWVELEGPTDRLRGQTAVIPAGAFKLRKDPEQWANKYMPVYAEGYAKRYAKFQEWCAGVDAAAQKPENVQVVAEMRADPRLKNSPHIFYNGWKKIEGAPTPVEFGFRDGDDAQFARSEYTRHYRYYADYQNLPQRETGAYLMLYSLGRSTGIAAGDKWPAGRYTLRVRVAATDESPVERRFIEIGRGKGDAISFNVLGAYQVTGTLSQPQVLEIPVEIPQSGDREFLIRDKRPNSREGEFAMWQEAFEKTGTGPRPCIWIDYVELDGPQKLSQADRGSGLTQTRRIEPEIIRNRVESEHVRYRQRNESYEKWKASGGDVARLKEFGFKDKDQAEFDHYVWTQNNRWFQQYLDWPQSRTGLYLDNTVNETSEHTVELPADAIPGDYVLRVRIGRVPNMPLERAFLSFVEASPVDKDARTFLANRQITAEMDNPEVVEFPFRVVSNGPRKFTVMEKRPLAKEGISLPGRTRMIADPKQRDPVLWIDWLEWEGPFAHRGSEVEMEKILFEKGGDISDRDHARAVLERFTDRALRGQKAGPEFLEGLMRLFDVRIEAGDPFEMAIREPLSVILASPGFLYLSEPGVEQKPRRLAPLELATRLSYFLWSAPPDQTLLALAQTGDLLKPGVLSGQVNRMLDDGRSREFIQGFVHQWLRLDRLDFFQFNTKLYRDFDESTKAAARMEVYESFAHLLGSNGSLRHLLKSDYVMANGLLANYYGMEGVAGDAFRKVSLPEGSPRGGLLGMAAILAMGSNGEHTSPVERGAWVLRKLLHEPPPPAPPNVPQISRLDGKLLTTRERLSAHMEEPQCASCHRKIDPIGFGLENFDAAGRWRTQDRYEKRGVGKKEWAIDPAAVLHKGPAFKDYFELRDIIASKEEAFARGFTEALIEYSLGRPFGFMDETLAQTIVNRAKTRDFTLREFIHGLVSGAEFQRK